MEDMKDINTENKNIDGKNIDTYNKNTENKNIDMEDNYDIKITCNLELKSLQSIKKYENLPHGMSLIALTMIDPNNKGLEMNIKIKNELYFKSFIEHIINVWCNYKPISSYIRSYYKNNIYLNEYNNLILSDNVEFPNSINYFNNKKIIVDIIEDQDFNFTFKIYQYGEIKARLLQISFDRIQSIIYDFTQDDN